MSARHINIAAVVMNSLHNLWSFGTASDDAQISRGRQKNQPCSNMITLMIIIIMTTMMIDDFSGRSGTWTWQRRFLDAWHPCRQGPPMHVRPENVLDCNTTVTILDAPAL